MDLVPLAQCYTEVMTRLDPEALMNGRLSVFVIKRL